MGRRPQQETGREEQRAPHPPVPVTRLHAAPEAPLSAESVIALQQSAGNAKVAAALPRAEAAAAGPVAPPEGRGGTDLAQAALARCVAERSGTPEAPATPAPSLLLRSKLRAGGQLQRAVLHRAVPTAYGEWDTEVYEARQDVDTAGAPVPAAQKMRGADIKLVFKPNFLVNAELIGLTQTAQSIAGGTPAFATGQQARAITAADSKALPDRPGETDQGTGIDRVDPYNNPIYPVDTSPSSKIDDPSTTSFWGQHGHHFKDKSGTLEHQDAKLFDTPRLAPAEKNSRQVFEASAIATRGGDAGTYYGSVRWGWQTDGSGVLSKIPLTKISEGVPSSAFLKSAQLWNAGTTSTGAATVDLPVPDVKLASTPITIRRAPQGTDVQVPAGTRLVIVRDPVAPATTGRVRVVDGMHIGLVGDVDGTDWANITDERA